MDQKNFIVAIVLSVLIIVGWQYALPAEPSRRSHQQQTRADPERHGAAGADRPAGRPARRTRLPGAPAGRRRRS